MSVCEKLEPSSPGVHSCAGADGACWRHPWHPGRKVLMTPQRRCPIVTCQSEGSRVVVSVPSLLVCVSLLERRWVEMGVGNVDQLVQRHALEPCPSRCGMACTRPTLVEHDKRDQRVLGVFRRTTMFLPASTRAEPQHRPSACASLLFRPVLLATRSHLQIVDKSGSPPMDEDHRVGGWI